MGKISALAAAVLAAGATSAWGANGFEWGGDVRLRVESLGYIPIQTNAFVNQLFNRDRFRLWGSYAPSDDILFKVRLTNEFRFYDEGRQVSKTWDPWNENVPDNKIGRAHV
jgi:hypothetical protein